MESETLDTCGAWLNRPPTHDAIGYHPYVESEFAPGSGRCDKCAGGPDAEIHHKPVEPLERIAAALERLVELREFEVGLEPGQAPEIQPDLMPIAEGEL